MVLVGDTCLASLTIFTKCSSLESLKMNDVIG